MWQEGAMSQQQLAYRNTLTRRQQKSARPEVATATKAKNVGETERVVSVAAGAILAMLALGRRGVPGGVIGLVGGALAYRGATGHCSMYQAFRLSSQSNDRLKISDDSHGALHASASFLINKRADVLYAFWRDFQNLPQFMSHLESVRKIDDSRSHWVAKAPAIYGGNVEWDAEIISEEENKRIEWQSLAGSDVDHHGVITFSKALGDRGTNVRAELSYRPPAGKMGQWIAKLFGEEPKQQIHDDLRRFKRLMETGEVPSTKGQPRGTCTGRGVVEKAK
jgi:uncharacterized membrane protein